MQRTMRRLSTCMSTEWIRATDTDIWHEIHQAEERFRELDIRYTVRWVRSHPERRHTWLSAWNEDGVLNYMADSLATLALKEYDGSGNMQLVPSKGSKEVWYVYVQAKGGEKLRLTGRLRRMLKTHLRCRHYYSTYVETTQASHITCTSTCKGQMLHTQIDFPLLRKNWKPTN